jgi:hypothetical protein
VGHRSRPRSGPEPTTWLPTAGWVTPSRTGGVPPAPGQHGNPARNGSPVAADTPRASLSGSHGARSVRLGVQSTRLWNRWHRIPASHCPQSWYWRRRHGFGGSSFGTQRLAEAERSFRVPSGCACCSWPPDCGLPGRVTWRSVQTGSPLHQTLWSGRRIVGPQGVPARSPLPPARAARSSAPLSPNRG